MQTAMNWCRVHPKTVFVMLAVLTIVGLYGAAYVEFKVNTRQFMNLNAERAHEYQSLYDSFGSDNYGLIYLQGNNLLTPSGQQKIRKLESKLESVPAIQSVRSPLTQPVLQEAKNGIRQTPLLSAKNEQSIGDPWSVLRSEPLFRDHMVSMDRRGL